MDEVFEYANFLDGKAFTCLYRRRYDERLGYYTMEMIPGSLRWSENGD